MARTLRNAKLDTPSARTKLSQRREPYWVVISKGCAIGYRKMSGTGTWVARYRDDIGKQHYHSVGSADDAMGADNISVFSYADAQRKAEAWFKLAARGFEEKEDKPSGAYLVRDAINDYLEDYKRRGGKGLSVTQSIVNSLILPELGDINLGRISRRRIENWHSDIAKSAPRLRTKVGQTQKFRKIDENEEARRRRKSTANRVLTVLKAALNRAYNERKTDSDDAWRSVKPFREVDGTRIRYLNDEESLRLVNACSVEFRPLVQAALLTGCRYSELTNLTVADYNSDSNSIWIAKSKSGKARHIYLTDEGKRFFEGKLINKVSTDHILLKEDGNVWGKSHQQRPFKEACKKAKVGSLTFHELRHTYASRLIMNGVSLAVIASQLGHTSTRMVEKHYGHLAPSHIAESVRAGFKSMGIVSETNVMPLKKRTVSK